MQDAPIPQLFDFLKTHQELGQALGSRMTQRLEQEHNLQLKDLIIAREIHHGARYPSEIADRLRIPRDMVSRSIDRLMQIGTISREIDPKDSRRTILTINPEGEEKRLQVQKTIYNTVHPLVSGLTEDELSTFISLMRKLLDSIYEKERTPQEKENA
ncbi:MarR family winged helix-turn-helix transcriptional regulator [Deinococcus cellulosilyticus]|uniref:HTH marR-type domain-containing protein n=1 Tax=Deinococcus cellulosilyticus (strain DSM 18568 / NBRC 106333 / KACC 11606 / 5516J-15) TaxID=1223518 RepID=A0A511N4J1_DEIC1|nr:MarR family winged helix-turn-helix transcriptional regulator [Deinococcus cellulosilyticus]GEM47301.1 hypothetical protein DC3_29360 [Deinococcus cellulosilyticus NBRC 106333 = KACC 11606]